MAGVLYPSAASVATRASAPVNDAHPVSGRGDSGRTGPGRSWPVAESREECGYSLDHRVHVPRPGLMIDAGQNLELRTGDVFGQVARLGDRNEFVRPMQDKGRCAQPFEQPLGAAVGERSDDVPDHGRAGGGSLERRGNPAGHGIRGQAWGKRVERPSGAPAVQEEIQFRPGFWWRWTNGRAVQHQARYRMGGGEADSQRTSLTETEHDGCRGSAGGGNRGQVLDSLVGSRRRDRGIGQAGAELVVTDESAVPGQPAREPPIPR